MRLFLHGPLTRWLARPRVLPALAGATVLAILLFQWPASPAASSHFQALVGAPPFDERVAGYQLSGMMADMHLLGEAGVRQYEAYRLLDLVFPWLLCGLVGAMLVRLQAAAALPLALLAALLDTAENLALGWLLLTRADPSAQLVPWASLLTQLKFAAYSLMLLGLLVAGGRYLWRARHAAPGALR